jgi:alkylhydroperoxidase/carboxymuconolactone decarboxylase family protein YurZ
MKKSIFTFFISITFLGMQSCGESNTSVQEETPMTEEVVENDPWDEAMDSYHDVMAATFHPAEENNLAPLKERYKELADQSIAWGEIAIPEKHQGKELDNRLEELKAQSVALSEMVEGGSSDEDLKEAIVALHDVFHGIMGACKDGEKHGMHH